eukprot:2857893-Pyramimonas_sp.AAC.3
MAHSNGIHCAVTIPTRCITTGGYGEGHNHIWTFFRYEYRVLVANPKSQYEYRILVANPKSHYEYRVLVTNRNTQSLLLASTGSCIGIPRMRNFYGGMHRNPPYA